MLEGGGGLEAASQLPQFIDKCIFFVYKKILPHVSRGLYGGPKINNW